MAKTKRRLPVEFPPVFKCNCAACQSLRAAESPPPPIPARVPDIESRVGYIEAWIILARVGNPELPDLLG